MNSYKPCIFQQQVLSSFSHEQRHSYLFLAILRKKIFYKSNLNDKEGTLVVRNLVRDLYHGKEL